MIPSGNDFFDGPTMMDIGALSAGYFQLMRIEAQLVQDRGVYVGDIVRVFDGIEAQFVGRSMSDAALDAAAGQPAREALRVMIATGTL